MISGFCDWQCRHNGQWQVGHDVASEQKKRKLCKNISHFEEFFVVGMDFKPIMIKPSYFKGMDIYHFQIV
jgi:hypothetical protein